MYIYIYIYIYIYVSYFLKYDGKDLKIDHRSLFQISSCIAKTKMGVSRKLNHRY